MAQAVVHTRMSEQEYLELERSSPDKHEYADGEVFAMAGGSLEHSAIATNLLAELRIPLLGRGCRALTSDMRIKIPATGRYVYPDGSVVCAKPEFTDEKRDTLLNPRLLVEVLSDSTEAYDRGDKFAGYRTITSLDEYVIASQKEPRIEVFSRQQDGSWSLRIYGPGQRVTLTSLGCAVEVDRVYTDVFTQGPE
ncbi:Uma2 family endonuclease [Sorangium sp. So ce131]|uniref:Uma2 family endonuclease n=1 Tax=Sorangium sp. So ce131 TaxID=3133282 RepID=UPI003F623D37